MSQPREGWSARLGFLSAAIGSAVGLGNVWRFPNLSYTYGGGAFFVPYLLAMVFIGVPILTLEFALGQIFRSGDIVAFNAINKRLRGVGIGSVWCGFMVVCYYVLIIAWAITMLINSFQSSETNPDSFKWTTFDGGPVAFFLDKVVGLGPLILEDGSLNRSTNVVPQTFVGVTFAWLCVYLCTFKGPKLAGRITYVTMFVPFVLLLVLACFFGSLDGASDGIDLYIGEWDLSKLSGSTPRCAGGTRACDEAWPDAVAQVFFSIGVTFGVMTAYASYNPVHQGVQMDALVCAFSDAAASFLAGFAVFAGLGVFAMATGTSVESAAGGSGGLGLVFWVMPSSFEALGQAPYNFGIGVRKFWAVLFYLTVTLLGIDSAFSLCEGFSTCVKDSRLFKDVSREATIGMICVLGYIISLVGYCNDTGLYMLDTVDYYINVTMLFVGFMECFAAGWIVYSQEQIERVGLPAWFAILFAMSLASTVAPWVGLGLGNFSEHAENGTWTAVLMGSAVFCTGLVLALRLARRHEGRQADSVSSVLYDLLLFNVEKLRGDFNGICGGEVGNLSIPMLWSLLVKFFIPPVLMLMLQLKFTSRTFGDYEGYHQWYQGWGIAIAFLPFLLLAVSLASPEKYDDLMPEKEVTLAEHTEPHQKQQETQGLSAEPL